MKRFNKKAFSIVEYAILFVIIISAYLIMKHYIQRGVYGMWQQAGQGFAYGRQYDPQRTIECDFDQASGQWFDHHCMVSTCHENPGCIATAISAGTCSASYCTTLN